MAKKITIDIEVNGRMQKATLSAKKLRSALNEVDTASQGVEKGSRTLDRNLKGAAKTTSNSTKEFSKMAQGMGGLVGAYATVAASVFALSAAFQFFKTVGDLAALTAGQELFAAKTGVSMKLMTKNIQDATGGLVAFREAAQAAAIGEAAGLSADQMERLGAVAKNAGTILGRDVTDAFNRLTRGAIKAEPELLDELGIIVRINDAAEAYGRTIGKNAQDLTQFEKSQAIVNAVLEQGESKFDDVGDSINSVAQFAAAFQDTFKELSKPIAEVANFIAKSLGDSILGVSSILGILGLNIVKSFAPAGPALKNTAKEGIEARKRLMEAAHTETNSTVADEIRKGEFTNKNLKHIETAAKSKTSIVMNLSKMERTAIERDIAIIRAQNLRMTMDGKNAFARMITGWRIQLLMFQADYGKTMGYLKAATAVLTTAVGKLFGALSFVGLIVILVELGKQFRRTFMIGEDLREAEEATEKLNKKLKEQSEAIKEVTANLKKPTSELNRLNQKLGVLANFNLAPISAQINLLEEAVQRLAEAEEKRKKARQQVGIEEGPEESEKIPLLNVAQKARLGVETFGDLNKALKEQYVASKNARDALDVYKTSLGPLDYLIANISGKFKEHNAEIHRYQELKMVANQNGIRLGFNDAEAKAVAEILEGLENSVPTLIRNFEMLEEQNLAPKDVNQQKLLDLKDKIRLVTAELEQNPGSAELRFEFEKLIEESRGVIDSLETQSKKAASVKASFTGLTNAVQQFGDASQKFMPKSSNFSGIFQGLDELDRNLMNIVDTYKDTENFQTIGQLIAGDDEGKIDQEGAAIRKAYEIAIKGEKDFNDEEFRGLQLSDLRLMLSEKRAKLAKIFFDLERASTLNKIEMLKAEQSILPYQQKAFNATKATNEAEIALTKAKKEQEMLDKTNLSVTEEQRILAKDKVDLAQAEYDIAVRREALERRLVPIRKELDNLGRETERLNTIKEVVAQERKILDMRKQFLSLEKKMVEDRVQEEIDSIANRNPFFDKELATARAKVSVAEAFLEIEKQQVESNYNLKVKEINNEYALLEAKRKQSLLELEIKAAEARDKGGPNAERIAREYESIAAVYNSIDFKTPRDTALLLAAKTKEASLYGLEKIVRDSKRALEELDPLDQVLDAAADAFEKGLNNAVNGIFDSLIDGSKSMSEALKDAARGVLSAIQKEVTQRLIVDPLLDALFGEETTAETQAKAAAQGMQQGAQAVKTTLQTANINFETTFTSASNNVKTALSTGGGSVARQITEALTSNRVKIECCKGPKGPKDPAYGPDSAASNTTVTGTDLSRNSEYYKQNSQSVFDSARNESDTALEGAMAPQKPDISMPILPERDKNTAALEGLTGVMTENNLALGQNILGLGLAVTSLMGNSRAAQSLQKVMAVLYILQMSMKIIETIQTSMIAANTAALIANTAAQTVSSGGSIMGFARYGGITEGYSSGGIAKGPQSGYPTLLHGSEAVVPLPDGKTIPVALSGAAGQQNNVTVNVSVDNQGNATQRMGGTSENQAAGLGKAIAQAVQQELVNQKRSGGILSPYGTA